MDWHCNMPANRTILSINTNKVECDEGFKNVLNVLDEYYNFNSEADLINTYEKFKNIVRVDGQDIFEFIDEFDYLRKKLESYGNRIVDHQLAHKLLIATKLTATQMEIIKAVTVNFTYASVKASLRRTFQNWTEISHPVYKDEKTETNNYLFSKYSLSRDRSMSSGHQSNLKNNMSIKENQKENKDEKYVNPSFLKTALLNQYSTDSSVNSSKFLHQEMKPKECIAKDYAICCKCASLSTHALPSGSTNFNDLLFMDAFKIHNGTLVLILMDTCTFYSEAMILNTTDPRETIENLYKVWINIFGKPLKLLIQNDDLSSEKFLNAIKSPGVEICASSKSSALNNCLCRKYVKIRQRGDYLMNQTKCSLKVSLAWAINGMNCSKTTNNEFSSSQLTFGLNLLLPSVHANKPPQLSHKAFTDVVNEFLESKRLARKTFIQTEISGLFRRRSNQNFPCVTSTQYFNGDKVFFKSPDDINWQGPGTIISHKRSLSY